MKAHKLPSGSWRVQVQINGVRRSFTAKSKKEAERAALESILNRPEAPTIDFRHAVEYFIANRENVLSASTTARYKRIVKKYMQELMPVQLRYLTTENVIKSVKTVIYDGGRAHEMHTKKAPGITGGFSSNRL